MREAKLNSNAQWKEIYKSVETTAEESVNGEACYRVVMTPPGGRTRDALSLEENGPRREDDRDREYATGVRWPPKSSSANTRLLVASLTPAKVTEKTAGQEITITIDSVEVNPEIPSTQFAMPADVAALVDNGRRFKRA
ncbi:MAG: hypothetical protein WDO18_18510 [Acidobacteriota bacterium]